MKNIFLTFIFLLSLNNFASTAELFYFFYPDYYEEGLRNYEVNFCHKNNAKLLKELKLKGANLEEIEVVIIQRVKGQDRLSPQNTRFDSKFAWHVLIMHDGLAYDLNAKFNAEGIPYEDYFPYILGYKTKLEDVLIRVIKADRFYNYFYDQYDNLRPYNAQDFVDRFLAADAKIPLTTAKMLKWYFN